MQWNSKTLTDLVKANYLSEEELEHFKQQLQSVHRKIDIGRYHAYTALNAFNDVIGKNEKIEGPIKAIKLILGTNDVNRSNFLEARLVAEANTLALAQNMHSLSGIIANVIHSALSIQNSSDKRIKGLAKHINDSQLKSKLVNLTGTQEFSYLDALVNNSKHENLTSSSYSVSLENDIHGMKYITFMYKGKPYKEKWYKDFYDDIDSLFKKYISILCSLTEYIEENA